MPRIPDQPLNSVVYLFEDAAHALSGAGAGGTGFVVHYTEGGEIAMMDGEEVKGGRGMLVDAYLVEMRSLHGFSGSPVFVCIGPGSFRGTYGPDNKAKMMPFHSQHIGLLGIDTGHKNALTPVRDRAGNQVKRARVIHQNAGMAIVAPYYKIRDVLEGGDLVRQRQRGRPGRPKRGG